MKQVVQAVNGGPVRVVDVPRPTIGPTEVLVRTLVTTISPGTERAVTALARANLLDKARARPDLVRQVVAKARTDGIATTAKAVRTRLDQDMPLGYSGCGIAVEVGDAVEGIAPGQLVATGGASKANHAAFQAVPGLLCVPVPDGVTPADAAMSTIASIALHSLRLGELAPGGKVVVIGLGLVGQLAARLALASGSDVYGIDVDEHAVELARAAGASASVESGDATTKAVLAWSRERGADSVIVAAAGSSSAVMQRVPELCRDRATVVVVGDVGLDLDRRPYYERELSVRFARSYGPGRYERSYEDWAVDYPAGQVRFTEGRNLETVLDLLASKRLRVDDLVTHGFAIDDAAVAYELIEQRREPIVGVQLTYGDPDELVEREPPIRVHEPTGGSPGVGLIGAGAFVSTVLLPAMRDAGFDRLVSVTSASGLSARHLADRAGFARAASGPGAVIDDDEVDVVVIGTPHDLHASLTARALRAGKHVFCEKPLALTLDELADVEAAAAAPGAGVLFVGFNRRWSQPIQLVRDHFGTTGGPLVVSYRVNAGSLPADHWYHDRRQGGRLLGEVCHFVDTCAAIVGETASEVQAVAGGAPSTELELAEDLAIVLRYPGGSVASITYAAGGHRSVEKENIEVLGRGRAAAVHDFRSVVLDDGKPLTFRPADKGHAAEARRLFELVTTGGTAPRYAFDSTRTTLLAAASLREATTRDPA